MSTRVAFDTRIRDIDPVPDQSFRVAFGCYLGAIVTAFSQSAILAAGIDHPAAILFAGMTNFIASLALGSIAIQRWEHGPERLGETPWRFLFVVPGIGLILLGVLPSNPAVILVTYVFTGGLTVLLGGGLARMARNRHVRVWTGDQEPAVRWHASKPMSVRLRRLLAVNAVGLPPLVAIGVVVFAGSAFDIIYIIQTLGAMNVAVFASSNRELGVYDSGLIADTTFAKGIYHWDHLDGYRLTDSELRIERSWRPDLRFDRDQIEDVDAVVTALDEYLPSGD